MTKNCDKHEARVPSTVFVVPVNVHKKNSIWEMSRKPRWFSAVKEEALFEQVEAIEFKVYLSNDVCQTSPRKQKRRHLQRQLRAHQNREANCILEMKDKVILVYNMATHYLWAIVQSDWSRYPPYISTCTVVTKTKWPTVLLRSNKEEIRTLLKVQFQDIYKKSAKYEVKVLRGR